VIAVDTNVLVRFLTRDDPKQSARAVALFGSEEIWIAKTVLLETEWVLRSLYRFKSDEVANAFHALAGLSNAHVEDAVVVARAFDLWGAGWILRMLCISPAVATRKRSRHSTKNF
jgi:predicted nucleic-acid-binding protein